MICPVAIEVGVIAPRVIEMAGAVVELETVPLTPAFVETLTDVTEPVADVGAHDADTEFCAHDAVPNNELVGLNEDPPGAHEADTA